MKLSMYQKLISALPVGPQAFSSKLDTWTKKVSPAPPALAGLFTGGTATISRDDIFKLSGSGGLTPLIYSTIIWGYPAGMRGNHFANIHTRIANLEGHLKGITGSGIADWRTHWNRHFSGKEYPGLKLSTYSKFLYFLGASVEGVPALILDNVLIEVFRSQKFDELKPLKGMSYSTAPKYYVAYLEAMHAQAKLLKVKPDQLEMFLFMFGPILKP